MSSIVSQIVVVLVNRKLIDRSVSWPRVNRRYQPFYPVMIRNMNRKPGIIMNQMLIMKRALGFRRRCTTWILSVFSLELFSLVHDLYLNLALFHGKVSSLSDLQGICAPVFFNMLSTSENALWVQELLLWPCAERVLFIRFQISLSRIERIVTFLKIIEYS